MVAFLDLIDDTQDKQRFSFMYHTYSALMYRVAYQLVQDAELAEDCVQEAFFFVARHFDRIDDDILSNKTRNYLITIVRCVAIKIHNKQLGIEFVELTEDIPDWQSPEMDCLAKCTVNQVRAAMNRLDESYRLPLHLKVVYEMKSSEIARLMGISDAAVRQRIRTARKKIKEMIEREDALNG